MDANQFIVKVIIRVLSLKGRDFRNLARDKKNENIARTTTIETNDDDQI